jgi:hypothetical protein
MEKSLALASTGMTGLGKPGRGSIHREKADRVDLVLMSMKGTDVSHLHPASRGYGLSHRPRGFL